MLIFSSLISYTKLIKNIQINTYANPSPNWINPRDRRCITFGFIWYCLWRNLNGFSVFVCKMATPWISYTFCCIDSYRIFNAMFVLVIVVVVIVAGAWTRTTILLYITSKEFQWKKRAIQKCSVNNMFIFQNYQWNLWFV